VIQNSTIPFKNQNSDPSSYSTNSPTIMNCI